MSAEWYYESMGGAIGPVALDELIQAINKGAVGPDTNIRRGESSKWVMAADVKGLMAAAKSAEDAAFEEAEAQERRKIERRRKEQELREKDEVRWMNLTVSTCAPAATDRFEIIDTVFALESDGKAGLFYGKPGDAEAAFERVKEQLREQAFAIGADAVINCQFEHRIAVTGDGLAAKQVVELFGYGTGIRFIHGTS